MRTHVFLLLKVDACGRFGRAAKAAASPFVEEKAKTMPATEKEKKRYF
jgi:hypothetical protein